MNEDLIPRLRKRLSEFKTRGRRFVLVEVRELEELLTLIEETEG